MHGPSAVPDAGGGAHGGSQEARAAAEGCKRRARSAKPKRPVSGKRPGGRTEKRPSSRGRFPTRAGVCIAAAGGLAVSGGAAPPKRRLSSSARSASPSRTCSARSSPRRWSAPAGRRCTSRSGQHRHPRAGARQRRGRPLPRVHRHDRARAAQARRQSFARRAEPLARAARPDGRDAVRLQQHLCAGDERARRERSASAASPTCSRRRRPGSSSACRTSSCSAPTAGRRCARPTRTGERADRPRPRPGVRRGRRGRVDVIDVYSTDAKLGRLGLTVLEDDRGFFPKYDAVVLMRADVDPRRCTAGRIDRRGDHDRDERRGRARRPQLRRDREEVPRRRLRVGGLAGREQRGGRGPGAAAAPASAAAREPPRPQASLVERVFAPDFARLAGQHLLLVFGSLALALAVGVPLGVAAWRWPRSGRSCSASSPSCRRFRRSRCWRS